MRQSKKLSMDERMRQNVIQDLKKMGVTDVGGNALHNLDYQELKWHLALLQAKNEGEPG